MTNNDILRRLRYSLDIPDTTMLEIFDLAGHAVDRSTLAALLKKEDDPEYIPCGDDLMNGFLDGLIIHRRGRREGDGGQQQPPSATRLNNNLILKKLRIALELREEELIALLKLAGVNVSRPELSALFRSKGHKHYKECGDQFLRNVLKGLTLRHRGAEKAATDS